MVFNQLLWAIHPKVINKLQKADNFSLSEIAPCDNIPSKTKVLTAHFQEIVIEYKLLEEHLNKYCASNGLDELCDYDCDKWYSEAFLQGVNTVIANLDQIFYKIEESYLNMSEISILQIHTEYIYLKNILSSLNIALRKYKEDKFSGCKILDLLAIYINSESLESKEVFLAIQSFCLKVFYYQIKHWLVQLELDDPHEEFFIKKFNDQSLSINSEFSVTSTETSCGDQLNDPCSLKYEVNASNLPTVIPFSVAVKVLFIGESLIMCQHKKISCEEKDEHPDLNCISPQYITSQFSKLENNGKFDSRDFTYFIDDLWTKVNKYICRISDVIGNVNSELVLMWDMYLLGRDELFQEFLSQSTHLLNSDITIVTSRNLNVALRESVFYVYSTENCNLVDQFYFKLPNKRALMEGLSTWSVMFLDCKVKWPLRYLFTPQVIIMYNNLFRFLLKLKKAQMDVTVACHRLETDYDHSLNMEFVEMKIHLVSIVSNLRNYCLTSVIADEMHSLLSNIKTLTMCTELQKSVLFFLTNVSDRLFVSDLLRCTDESIILEASEIHETVSKKVNGCFIKIFLICEQFSNLVNNKEKTNILPELTELKENLYSILKLLFSLLQRIDQNLYQDHSDSLHIYTHLSNLIMCLDYNNFYHEKFKLDIYK